MGLRIPGRANRQPAGAGGPFSVRLFKEAVFGQPEGGGRRTKSNGGRLRVSDGPVVESRRRTTGDGPYAPHRPERACVCVPVRQPRYRRGEDPAPAGEKTRPGREAGGGRIRHLQGAQTRGSDGVV